MESCSSCDSPAAKEAVVPTCERCAGIVHAFVAALQAGKTNEFGAHLSPRRKEVLRKAQVLARDILSATIGLADPATADEGIEPTARSIGEMWEVFVRPSGGVVSTVRPN